MAASTRARVAGSTRGLSFTTRETVCPDTPAAAATSAIDTRRSIRWPPSDARRRSRVLPDAAWRTNSSVLVDVDVITGDCYRVDVNMTELRSEELGAGVVKRPTRLADGRELIYYDDPGTSLGPERSADARDLAPRP